MNGLGSGADAARRRARVGALVGLGCWVYLMLAVSLAAWVGVTTVVLGWRPVVVTSASMAPNLQPGDVVMLAHAPPRGLERGDLVRFRAAEGSVIHRIVKVNPDGSYLTKGDANPTPDPTPVAAGQVSGVGRLLVPFVGRPWLWRSQGQWGGVVGWVLLTVAAASLAVRTPRLRQRPPNTTPAPQGALLDA